MIIIIEITALVVGLLLVVASINSLYSKCNNEKNSFLDVIGIIIGFGILLFLAIFIVGNLNIGRPILIDGMNIGEKYFVWSLGEELDNQICLRLEDESGEIKTYRIEKEKMPIGLCANDTLTKYKDGTLDIYQKATTNQTMGIKNDAHFILGF